MRLFDGLLDLIFPPRKECPFCGTPQERFEICAQCQDTFREFRQEPVCFQCGRYFQKNVFHNPVLLNEVIYCQDCTVEKRFFSFSRSVGPYEGILKNSVHKLKYFGKKGLAMYIAQKMFEVISEHPQYLKVQAIASVSLSNQRHRQRGFNQSELLASYLSDKMKIEIVPVIHKIKDTIPQADLNRMQRKENLAGVFALTREKLVEGKTILLVDDVVTTGSTLNSVSEVLIRGGASKVLCIAATAGRVAGDPILKRNHTL